MKERMEATTPSKYASRGAAIAAELMIGFWSGIGVMLPSGLLCWWIFIVPEVVLNLEYLSIFSGLAALMSADIARNL